MGSPPLSNSPNSEARGSLLYLNFKLKFIQVSSLSLSKPKPSQARACVYSSQSLFHDYLAAVADVDAGTRRTLYTYALQRVPYLDSACLGLDLFYCHYVRTVVGTCGLVEVIGCADSFCSSLRSPRCCSPPRPPHSITSSARTVRSAAITTVHGSATRPNPTCALRSRARRSPRLLLIRRPRSRPTPRGRPQ